MVLWGLWVQRNEIIWKDKNFSSNHVTRLASTSREQWLKAKERRGTQNEFNLSDIPHQNWKTQAG